MLTKDEVPRAIVEYFAYKKALKKLNKAQPSEFQSVKNALVDRIDELDMAISTYNTQYNAQKY